MRALSSAASITLHAALGAAVLLGPAKSARPSAPRERDIPLLVPRSAPARESATGGIWTPGGPPVPSADLGKIPVPDFKLPTDGTRPTSFPVSSGISVAGTAQADGWVMIGSQEGPEVLTAPLPRYPELMRQAGREGRVVLEASVGTNGRVNRDSILLVEGTNPEFVAAARQALVATLFRPALVAGRAVPTRIRVPYQFTIRNGTGHAR